MEYLQKTRIGKLAPHILVSLLDSGGIDKRRQRLVRIVKGIPDISGGSAGTTVHTRRGDHRREQKARVGRVILQLEPGKTPTQQITHCGTLRVALFDGRWLAATAVTRRRRWLSLVLERFLDSGMSELIGGVGGNTGGRDGPRLNVSRLCVVRMALGIFRTYPVKNGIFPPKNSK